MSLVPRQPWSRIKRELYRTDIDNHLHRPLPDDLEDTIAANARVRRYEEAADRRRRRHP